MDMNVGTEPKRYGTGGYTLDWLKNEKDKHFAAGGSYDQLVDWASKNKVDIGEANRDWDARSAKPAAPKVQPATYTPTLRDVDPTKETIEGRIPGLLNSEMARQAGTAAKQAMNSRGLINSSMAEQASQAAILDKAVQIAGPDAQTYTNVSNLNQGYQNQAAQTNAAAQNQFGLQHNAGVIESGLIGERGNQEMALQALRGQQAQQLAVIESQYKNLMQSSASASSLFAQTQQSIADVLKEPNIAPDQKGQMIAKLLELLKSGMSVIGGVSNLNLPALLRF